MATTSCEGVKLVEQDDQEQGYRCHDEEKLGRPLAKVGFPEKCYE